MWLNKENKKPISLKKLLQSGFDVNVVMPEPLALACPITNGIASKKIDWVLELEKLAAETDPYIVEINLKRLLDQIS